MHKFFEDILTKKYPSKVREEMNNFNEQECNEQLQMLLSDDEISDLNITQKDIDDLTLEQKKKIYTIGKINKINYEKAINSKLFINYNDKMFNELAENICLCCGKHKEDGHEDWCLNKHPTPQSNHKQ